MEESSHSTQSSKQNPPFQEDLRSGTGNPDIDHAVSFWKQFDLTTARAQWDKICNDMREMKTASISGRKRLNDLTKSFRAKSREEQTSQVQDLVKAYQEEIDQLSRRSKLSEVSFFDLHKSLYDAPDPGFFLEQLLHTSLHSNSHVLEIEKLKAELAQYDDEFQRLKNQEVTIRRLEDQLTDFQQRNEVKVEEEVERRVDLIRQQCQEEVLEAKEMQKATERRLSVALEAVKQAQSQSERCQAQLLEVSEKYENKLSAMMSENSLLAENIQRLQLRCSEMESENDHLKKGAVIATSSATSSPHPKSDSADLAFTADRQTSLELLVAQLRGQVQEKEEQVRQERLVADAALREAQLLYAKEKEQLARARQELQSRPSPRDVTALRRRLRLVEKIAFHGARADRGEGRGEDDVEEEMEEHDGDGDDVAPENHSVPLENLLTAKILGLERDVTALRRQNLDLTETQSSQTDVIASLKQTLEHRQQALARAERELEARNALLERMMKEQSAKKENALTSLEDLLADVTSPPPLSANNQAASHSLPSREGGGGDDVAEASSQMIAILTNQRDRYKERLTQAEALLLKSEETSEALRAAKTQLEEENVQLYSKIKYLQNANTTSASTSTSSSSVGRNNNHNNKRAFDGRASSEESRLNHDRQSNLSDTFYFRQHSDDVESKYDSLYEQRMNPFAEFSLHEKQRKLRELSVADRIVLNTTLAIIQSNAGRNFVLIYFGAMHLLVFFTIYYTAHNVHHGCDPSLDHLTAH